MDSIKGVSSTATSFVEAHGCNLWQHKPLIAVIVIQFAIIVALGIQIYRRSGNPLQFSARPFGRSSQGHGQPAGSLFSFPQQHQQGAAPVKAARNFEQYGPSEDDLRKYQDIKLAFDDGETLPGGFQPSPELMNPDKTITVPQGVVATLMSLGVQQGTVQGHSPFHSSPVPILWVFFGALDTGESFNYALNPSGVVVHRTDPGGALLRGARTRVINIQEIRDAVSKPTTV